MSPIVAPPWRLSGCGYLILLAPAASRREAGGAATGVHPRGGFGVIMVMDYRRSGVGPYRELLYIPGRVSVRAKERGSAVVRTVRGHSISRIYVTSELSRSSGIVNWGIPKEVGRFIWKPVEASTETILVTNEFGAPMLDIEISRRGTVSSRPAERCSIPVSARFLPHTLVQVRGDVVYRTSIRALGRAQLAGGVILRSHARQTEELAARRVLLAFFIPRVFLHFPQAVTLPLAGSQAE